MQPAAQRGERYSNNGENDEAIAFGVGSTARLITGAALIIMAVFWGFPRGDLIMFQQMGFGVAAVLIDATIVGSVLVPASMKLLGGRNWCRLVSERRGAEMLKHRWSRLPTRRCGSAPSPSCASGSTSSPVTTS